MQRFLKNSIHRGSPLNAPGVAEAVTRMSEALSNMDCQPGTVKWHGNTPVIYPAQQAATIRLMDVRLATVTGSIRTQVYLGEKTQPLWSLVDGVNVTATTNTEDDSGWYRVAVDDSNGVIWAQLVDAGGTKVEVLRGTSTPRLDAVPIAIVDNGKVYQLRTGTITRDVAYDSDSIERNSSQELQLRDFETASNNPENYARTDLFGYKDLITDQWRWIELFEALGAGTGDDWASLSELINEIEKIVEAGEQPHSELADVIGGYAGDHHYWDYGDGGNVTYVRCGPGAGAIAGPTRNKFIAGSGLGDDAGLMSVDVHNRMLQDGADFRVDYDLGRLYYDAVIKVDWQNEKLGDGWWEVENTNALLTGEGLFSAAPSLYARGGIRADDYMGALGFIADPDASADNCFEILDAGFDNLWSLDKFAVETSDIDLLTTGLLNIEFNTLEINGDAFEIKMVDLDIQGEVVPHYVIAREA